MLLLPLHVKLSMPACVILASTVTQHIFSKLLLPIVFFSFGGVIIGMQLAAIVAVDHPSMQS